MSQIPTIPPEKLQEAVEAIYRLYEETKGELEHQQAFHGLKAVGPATAREAVAYLQGRFFGLSAARREFEKRAPLWIIGSSTPE
jgi:hypothetical protein